MASKKLKKKYAVDTDEILSQYEVKQVTGREESKAAPAQTTTKTTTKTTSVSTGDSKTDDILAKYGMTQVVGNTDNVEQWQKDSIDILSKWKDSTDDNAFGKSYNSRIYELIASGSKYRDLYKDNDEAKNTIDSIVTALSGVTRSYSFDAPTEDEDIAPVKTVQVGGKTIEVTAPLKKEGRKLVPVTEEDKKSYLQGKLFEDGWQFGDLTKTILGTGADLLTDLGTGIVGIGEAVVDAGAWLAPYLSQAMYYQNGGGYNLQADAIFKQSNDALKQEAEEFIKKDLYDEEAVTKEILSSAYAAFEMAAIQQSGGQITPQDIARSREQKEFAKNYLDNEMEEHSALGEKSDEIVQSGGQLIGTSMLQAIGIPWWVTTGVTSFGTETENALNQGATMEEAGASAAITAGAEMLTEKLSGGIKFGGKALDDALTQQIALGISDKVVRTLAKLGLDMAGEGFEEVLSNAISAVGQKITYDEDKNISFGELFLSEEAFDTFIAGAALGGTSNVINTGKSYIEGVDPVTGLTKNEQAVVDKVYNDAITEAEKNGKVSAKDKAKLYDEVLEKLEKGYISTDTIEEVLGDKTYKDYKTTVDAEDSVIKELEELYEGEELQQQVNDLLKDSTRFQMKDQLSREVLELVKGDRLVESYNERFRKGQKFEADLTQYDAKQQETIQRAIDSGILNNTNRTHEFVDIIAKISADKGVPFDFINNQKLRESGFAVDGKTVNGLVTDDGISINIDSQKAWQSTVGHEITHVLEGTELYDALQETLFEYAKSKKSKNSKFDSEYKERLYNTRQLYKDVKGYEGVQGFEKIKKEVVADLVGDYLFTDKNFINNLSTKNRNIFEKVYDEIKYLCKVATAGSAEARELEKVKRAFEEAYRADGKATTEAGDTTYSLTGKNKDGIEVYETSQSVMDLTWDERKAQYLDVMKKEYRGRTAKFERNGHVYYAKFDQSSVRKPIYGDSRSSTSGVKALIKAGADGDVFDLVENSQYSGSKRNTKTHTNADYFDYFVKTVQIDGKVFDLVADVEKEFGTDEGYVYTLALVDNKKIKASPALGTPNTVPVKSAGNASADNVAHDGENVNRQYSLSMVEAVQPKSNKWSRTLTTDEVKAQFPDLWDVAADESEVRNPTQISGTVKSYRKIYDYLKADGFDGTILDASSGLGYGTKAGIEEYGFNVEDIEPYPDKSYNPKYTDYSTLDKKYDAIISNAVLNVLPQDQRDALVVKMGEMLNDGGRIFVNVRGTDVKNASSKVAINEDLMEYYIAQSGSYQKGFKVAELVAYLQDTLGDGFTVEPTKMFGAVSAVVTKNGSVRYSISDSDGKELSKGQQEYFKDSKMRDEKGNLKVMYHGSQDAGFHTFDSSFSDDDTSFFFVDRNDVAQSYSGTTEVYEARTIRTVEDMNNFLAEMGEEDYKVVEENGKFTLYQENEYVADSDTAQGIYEEYCDWVGVGYGDANYKVYLNLKNPLVVDAQGRNWDNVSREFSQELADKYNSLTAEEKTALTQLASWEDIGIFRHELNKAADIVESRGGGDGYTRNLASAFSKLGEDVNMYDLFTIASDNFSEESIGEFAVKQLNTRDYAQRAKEQGYDGVIFNNIHDNGGYSNGSEGASTVAIAFDSNQIKSTANANPTSDPDIRYSVSEAQNEKGLDAKSEVSFSLSNDTAYMDKAIAANNSSLHVDSNVMANAKAIRGRIAARMNEIKDRGLVGLPDDIEGNTYIANSSYDGTEENTTICPRSLASEAFVDAVSEYLGRPLTVEEQIYISQDLQGRSLTPECTYCYVATDRKAYRAFLGEYISQRDAVLQKVKDNPNADVSRSGELYKEFLNGRKDTNPMYSRFKMWVDAYRNGTPMVNASHLANINRLMGEINSEFGEALKPQIVDAMKYAQSASWAKKRVNYVAYNGHILKWKQDRINKLNSHYGLRMYSFSDFHPAFVLENMQMITDASVRGLKMLGYTKDTDFVDIFAPSGMNINVSTFGFESGGNVYENNIIGAEWEKAKALREQYPNVGVTFVATNDTLVNWALEQDWIDVVIPYHLVRTGAEVAKAFNYTNYTSESSDVKDVGWTKGDKKYIAPTEHNNDKATYLAALSKNHLKPRFERFIDNPNYMKLVNECRQSASESKPVQPVFNEDAAMKALAKLEANGYYQPIGGSVDRMYEIAAEVAEDMTQELAPAMSISNIGEQYKYGNYSTPATELRYEAPVQEEIAPVSETTAKTKTPVSQTNLFPDDLAPMEDSPDRLASLDDSDVPPETEPYYGEDAPVAPRDPFEDRDFKGVGKRNVNAYMYDNPEVKPFFQMQAEAMLGDLQNSTKGEKLYNDDLYYESGGEQGWVGVERQTTDDIAYLLDMGYTYAQIEKGLKAIIEDNGAENIAMAKRIEFALNDRLIKGYTDINGVEIPANQDYINLLAQKQTAEAVESQTLPYTDADAPMGDFAPVAETVAPVESAPVAEKYEAIRPKPSKEPKLVRADKVPKQQSVAKVMTEEPNTAKDKQSAWSMFKNSFLDKGMVFEDLSLETGNRALQGKWNSIRYANGRAQKLIGEGNESVNSLDSIREAVEQSGKTQQFYEYLYHMHNIDRMTLEERYENTPNKTVFGDEVTADVSREAAAELIKENPEFWQWAKSVYDYNAYLRDLLVEGGVISDETATLWEEMYPHYVPIRRLGDDGLNINVPLDTGRTGVNAPIKRATGGNRDILPLFDTMAQRTIQTYKAIAKNRFGVELKNTLGTTIASELTDVDETIDSIDTQDGLLQEGKNGKKPTFTVFEDGKKVTFEITDEMYDAMKPTTDRLAYTNKALNTVNNIRRGLITEYNPAFMLTNPIKDTQDVLINSQHPAKTYANYPKAISELWNKNGRWYQEYMENGGEQNTYFDTETNTFAKEKSGIAKLIGTPLDKISDANNFIERIPRLAEYIASREMGRSVDVSMLDAARVTTNFAAGGDVTKFLNRNGFTFLNASVQGAIQQVRNVREAKANGLKGWAGLAAKVAAAGLPAMLLNHLLWDDDEEYAELSDYVKENYYIVGKFGDGQFVRIPKGRALAVIQNAFEQMENLVTGNDEVDLGKFAELVVSNLAPNNPLDNNIFAPIFQAASNTTWYGEDLVPTRLQDLPAAEQYDESTDAISRWLGEKLNVSPYKINYLLDQYSGGIGDVFLPMLTPEAESGDNSFFGNLLAPIKDKFTTDSVMNNQNVSDFYDIMDELTANAKSSKAKDEDVLMNKYMNSVNAELSELYKQKREIQNSDLSDAEKYSQVREIQQQIINLTRDSLNTYEDISYEDDYREGGEYARIGERVFKKNDEGEWEKLSDEQLTKYEVTKAAGNASYATDGENHYRWYVPEDDSDAEPGWRKVTDKQLEKQKEVTSGLGITAEKYWGNKDEYDYAYEHPAKYAVAKAVGGYDSYKAYSSDLYDLKADKDSSGKSISGSRKEKVIDYINNMDADYGEKIILFKSEYPADDTYNYDIIDYLNSRDDISYKEMETILKELGFEVDAKGNISW